MNSETNILFEKFSSYTALVKFKILIEISNEKSDQSTIFEFFLFTTFVSNFQFSGSTYTLIR